MLDGLAEYQMLLMMAKLSTGWTLSSSFSTLDPKQMRQISVCVVTISVLEVILLFWGTGLLQALVKIIIAGAFGVNISKKITEERSTLRKEFYIKFAKVIFCLFDSQFVILPTKQLPKGKSRDILHVIHILKFFQS